MCFFLWKMWLSDIITYSPTIRIRNSSFINLVCLALHWFSRGIFLLGLTSKEARRAIA